MSSRVDFIKTASLGVSGAALSVPLAALANSSNLTVPRSRFWLGRTAQATGTQTFTAYGKTIYSATVNADGSVDYTVPTLGTFHYYTGCNVSNVFGYNCSSGSSFSGPSGSGWTSYVETTNYEKLTASYPVPHFSPSYNAQKNYDVPPVCHPPHPCPQSPYKAAIIYAQLSEDVIVKSVTAAVATAGLCLAIVAFTATPVGWATVGVGAVGYGLSLWDLWRTK